MVPLTVRIPHAQDALLDKVSDVVVVQNHHVRKEAALLRLLQALSGCITQSFVYFIAMCSIVSASENKITG